MRRSAFNDALSEARAFFRNPKLTKAMVTKRSKVRSLVRIRWFMMAFMRARDPLHYSYPMIASAFGLKDHTTALHGVRNAHKEWGEHLFRKLALQVVEPILDHEAQVVHSVATVEALIAIGEAGMASFVNDRRWESAA